MIKHYFKDKHAGLIEKIAQIVKENSVLYPYCRGKGIDVGCGPHKIHPKAIGIDIAPKGTKFMPPGRKDIPDRLGGLVCQADIQARGDDLFMFKDNELDYVVSSHNLEHYQDTIKTLKEWKRVLKPGGILGVILPDDTRGDSMHALGHKHSFTPESFKNLIELIGGFRIIKLEQLRLKYRQVLMESFVCVMKKKK